MNNQEFANRLEFYSNAIIGFIVIQGLCFCFNLGTSDNFENLLHSNLSISIVLEILFLVVLVVSVLANHFIGKALIRIDSDHKSVIAMIYWIKTGIITLFGLMPLFFNLYPIFHFSLNR